VPDGLHILFHFNVDHYLYLGQNYSLKSCLFICLLLPYHHINSTFTRHSRSLFVPHAQNMEQLHVFGAWHHNWKFWGQNHDIYTHYMFTTIYWTIWICSFHPNSKSVSAHLGRALCVFFLPLSGSGWTIASSSLLLLLLKGECTLQVSLSESSLKLPPSESESFTISLVSFPINIFCEVFSELTLSPGFSHVACGAQNITLLLRRYWYVARHGVRKAKWLTASEGGKSAAIKQTRALSPRSKQLVAQLFSNNTNIHTYTPGKM